ncbi:hypothetical protein [Citrobacter sp. RHB21-C01]|uniref:hypothetical protein n=1 Tax=Citrobacter sp. RHB21-C01 TaxID=2742622 RepID=UPI0034D3B322
MKHTPGPWYWDSEGLGSKDVLVFGKGYPFEMTSTANRNLIAAAPDLLEALQLSLNAMNEMGDILNFHDLAEQSKVDELTPAFDKARAAISKALGEE